MAKKMDDAAGAGEVATVLSREFETTEDWLTALKDDSSLAIMPARLAAEALDEGIAPFKRKLASGGFPSVMIEGKRYAMAEAVRVAIEEWNALFEAIKGTVEDVARRREIIFYGDLMELHGMSWRNPGNRRKIGMLLGQLSHWSWEEHGILLSSIVHRKGTGQTLPGDGYPELMKIFADQYDDFDYTAKEDPVAMVQRHMEAVWDHYAGRKRPSQKRAAR